MELRSVKGRKKTKAKTRWREGSKKHISTGPHGDEGRLFR